MLSALDSGLSVPGSSPGWDHCVVFLGKTLYSLITYGAKLLNADWLRQRAFFLNHEGTLW